MTDLAYISNTLAEHVAALEGTDDVRVITQHGKPVAVLADYRHFRNLEDGFYPDEVPEEGDRASVQLSLQPDADNPTTFTLTAANGVNADIAASILQTTLGLAGARIYNLRVDLVPAAGQRSYGLVAADADLSHAVRVDALQLVAEHARHVCRALSGSELVEDLGAALQALDREQEPT